MGSGGVGEVLVSLMMIRTVVQEGGTFVVLLWFVDIDGDLGLEICDKLFGN